MSILGLAPYGSIPTGGGKSPSPLWQQNIATGVESRGFGLPDSGNQGLGPNQQASLVGAGVGTAMNIAEGIASGVQTKKLREAAELESMEDIARARVEREQQLDQIRKQDVLEKQQIKHQNLMADAGLRLQMFQRQIQKQAQRFQDGQAALTRIRQQGSNTDMIKDIFARNIGRV